MKPAATLVVSRQARIRKLEIENAVLRTKFEKLNAEAGRFMQAWAGAWIVNKARVQELQTELEAERARREAPIDLDSLPNRHRQKLKVARRRQNREFKDRVRQEAHRVLNQLFLDDAHSSLDNVLEGREPRVPKMTGYRDLRPVPGAPRKGARVTKH
jgi:hypothetical protein